MILRTLSPILSIVVAVVLSVFFIKPTYDETLALQKDTELYDEAKTKYDNFKVDLQAEIDNKASHLADEEKLSALVPESIDETQLLVDLKSIAKDNGLLFGNIGVSEGDSGTPETLDENGNPIGDDALIAMDFAFEVIGSYSQTKEFIKDLERSQTLFEIISISFDSSKNTFFQQFAFTVRTYAQPKYNPSL